MIMVQINHQNMKEIMMVESTKAATKWGTRLLIFLTISLLLAATPHLYKKYKSWQTEKANKTYWYEFIYHWS